MIFKENHTEKFTVHELIFRRLLMFLNFEFVLGFLGGGVDFLFFLGICFYLFIAFQRVNNNHCTKFSSRLALGQLICV